MKPNITNSIQVVDCNWTYWLVDCKWPKANKIDQILHLMSQILRDNNEWVMEGFLMSEAFGQILTSF